MRKKLTKFRLNSLLFKHLKNRQNDISAPIVNFFVS